MTSTSSTGSEITGLRQVALTVSDVSRSVEYYRDAVGLKFLFSAGPNLAFLDIGGVRLMLGAPEPGFTPGASSMLYFKVADIDAAYAEMGARGVTFLDKPHFLAPMPDHDLWLCAFRDPDGNPMALMCEKPKAS
jgi:catechol 2,3-dioxygenase-like lactoylglutathione lyase family enzyme